MTIIHKATRATLYQDAADSMRETVQAAVGTAFEALAAYAAARNNAQCAKSEAEVMDVTEASHE